MARDITKTKLKLEPHQIVLRPLVTEKGYNLAEHEKIYAFEVNKLASKADIKLAVEKLFSVKVVSVNTQNRHGKPRRTKNRLGRTRSWKRALVKLDDEHRIDFF